MMTAIMMPMKLWADFTVYVKADVAPYVYAYESLSVLAGTWPGTQMTQKATVGETEFWFLTLPSPSYDASATIIINNGEDGDNNRTEAIGGVSTDCFFIYDGGSGYEDVTSQYWGASADERYQVAQDGSFVPTDDLVIQATESVMMQFGADGAWMTFKYNMGYYVGGDNAASYNGANIPLGSNQLPNQGTYYKFTPSRTGSITVDFYLYPPHPFVMMTGPEGNPFFDYEIRTPEGEIVALDASCCIDVNAEERYAPYTCTFNVEAGKEYYILQSSSRPRFRGFTFSYSPITIDETTTYAYRHRFDDTDSGEKVIYQYADDPGNHSQLSNDVWVEINGNTSKTVSAGVNITINGKSYKTIKVSNGAQNTLHLSRVAKAVTFYSYINQSSGDEAVECYWREVAGTTYESAEASGGAMQAYRDQIDNASFTPDVRTYRINNDSVITFTNAGKQLCYVVEVEYANESDLESHTWTVAGAAAVCGTTWDQTDTSNDMTTEDGTIYRWVKNDVPLKYGNYEFKVARDHAWDVSYPAQNYSLSIVESGNYTVEITFNTTTYEINAVATKTGEYTGSETITWTVAGVSDLCGSSWDETDTSNDMTTENEIVYKWTKNEVPLNYNTAYQFKIVRDHDWDTESYPVDDYTIYVDEPGLYTVEITFNVSSGEITVSTARTGDYTFSDRTWTIAGVTAICGSEWDPSDTSNDMTAMGNGIFQLVKKNLTLKGGVSYEYKVAANHSWEENYGEGIPEGPNQYFSVGADGVYDVTFIFNEGTKELTASVALAGEMVVESYAVLADNTDVTSTDAETGEVTYGKTLTFYYDTEKTARNGMSVGPFEGIRDQSWYDYRNSITAVVFDNSFAACDTLTSTSCWFYECDHLTSITGIENLNTANVTSMVGMFIRCTAMTDIDVSHFNTANVTDMTSMFFGCTGLTTLDLSNFNTEKVTNMTSMFSGCRNLTTVYVGNMWSITNVTQGTYMFLECNSIMGGRGTNFDTTQGRTDYIYARIDGGQVEPGYFTPKYGYDFDVAFDGLVLKVDGNITMNGAMEYVGGRDKVIPTVAAVVWNNNTALSNSDMQGIENPNLLLYVQNKALAPGNVKNIVVGDSLNGYKAQQIVLTETEVGNGNFYCPIAFTANRITYEREFLQQTEPDSCRGWETITLPFQPQSIMHERYGQISPFAAAGDSRPFWLRELTSNGFQDAQRIEANRPYIISMPNYSGYDAEYQLGGRVSFSGYNCQVPQTRLQTAADSTGAIRFIPVLSSVEQGDSVYALNVGEEYLVDGKRYAEGSVFARGLEGVRPFHSYTQHASSTPAPRYMPIAGWILGDVTGINHVHGEGFTVQGSAIYNLTGQRVQNPKKGLYITHGKKVVVNW